MEKMLFIYNPHAGKGQVRGKLADILNAFTRAGLMVTAYPTQGRWDALRTARDYAADFDRVVVCGGDGTLHESINGLMALPAHARPILGYIPAGTTNDFARTLALPRSMVEAATLAATGRARPVDIGRLGDKYFAYVAAFGAFTDVSYNTPQTFKNMFGHVAYLMKGAAELTNLKSYRLRLGHDGGVLEGDYLYGMVSNTTSVGGILGLPAEEVSLNDGMVEVILIKMPTNVLEFQATIRGLARQEYTEENGIFGLHTSHISISCNEVVPFTLDGEFGGNYMFTDGGVVHTPIQIVSGKELT